MRAIVESGELAKALREVATAAERKPRSMPILQSVLLKVAEGQLTLRCTNLSAERSSRSLRARGAVDGAVVVPVRLMRDFARELARIGGPVLLEGISLGERKRTIGHDKHFKPIIVIEPIFGLLVMSTAYKLRARIVGLDPADFPPAVAIPEAA